MTELLRGSEVGALESQDLGLLAVALLMVVGMVLAWSGIQQLRLRLEEHSSRLVELDRRMSRAVAELGEQAAERAPERVEAESRRRVELLKELLGYTHSLAGVWQRTGLGEGDVAPGSGEDLP